ncbi:MAG TPA: ATP-dependent protease subunit HslV [Fimbriimonadaceae bacterium]|nr:ATP-dependent protease subunit HslV [Fimbriimonadaceae bacterium]HRJ96706.1 ATP-dependent protease subunit HslV [Fimbriimonadaceae bacterium]
MIRSTTVVGVRRNGTTAIAADGQVTLGDTTVLKSTAKKVRRLAGGKVVCGFAGSVADAQALLERFETKLEAFSGLRRAAVEFAKDWRTDRVLRQLNAMMIAADSDGLLLVSGDGNVIEPDDGVAGIGSGGPFALAAARALLRHTDLDAEAIARESLGVAAEICVFTNANVVVEVV